MKEIKNCTIIQDLLPNYIEKLTAKETNEFIEEHLKECNECQKILDNMKKEYCIETEKRDEREVEYIKKYNKKIKKLKKVFLVILAVFLMYALTVLYKYNILIKIYKNNEISNNNSNYFYRSISSDTIMECYKKDGIIKINMKLIKSNGDITLWKNSNTGEEFAFWNNEKVYSENAGGILTTNPSSSIISPDVLERIIVAANPTVFVGTQKYNDISCYIIKFGANHEIIDKNTGMVIYSGNESFIRNLEYSFNTVTAEDIAKPNLLEYTIKK